jgi:hypothetical protein
MAGFDGVVTLGTPPSASQLQEAGFFHVQRFIAIPGLTNLRWLIPAGPRAAVIATAILPRSHRLLARLERIALLGLLRLGSSFWRSRLVTIASRRQPAVLGALDGLFPGHDLRVSVSAGTPGPMRKPTLACFDGEGSVLAYAKVATSWRPEALLQNESAMLRHINETPRLRGIAPRLLLDTIVDGRIMVVQSALPGRAPSQSLRAGHRRFLDVLESDEDLLVTESAFVRKLDNRLPAAGRADELGPVLIEAKQALRGVRLPSTLMHGDFAPWNLREDRGYIRAFDWEYGVVDGLAGFDNLHYVWQTGLLLKKWDAATARSALESCARSQDDALDARQAKALVAIYLLHGLLDCLESGCDETDLLAEAYRTALALQPVTREAARV